MKLLKVLVYGLTIVLIVILTLMSYSTIRKQQKVKMEIQKMPEFNFVSLAGTHFTKENVANRPKVIINLFDPECDHCVYMTQEFINNKHKLSDVYIIMVTRADVKSIEAFNTLYKLDSVPFIRLLRDPDDKFKTAFGTTVIPSFFIYNHGLLTSHITGETKLENLLK